MGGCVLNKQWQRVRGVLSLLDLFRDPKQVMSRLCFYSFKPTGQKPTCMLGGSSKI